MPLLLPVFFSLFVSCLCLTAQQAQQLAMSQCRVYQEQCPDQPSGADLCRTLDALAPFSKANNPLDSSIYANQPRTCGPASLTGATEKLDGVVLRFPASFGLKGFPATTLNAGTLAKPTIGIETFTFVTDPIRGPTSARVHFNADYTSGFIYGVVEPTKNVSLIGVEKSTSPFAGSVSLKPEWVRFTLLITFSRVFSPPSNVFPSQSCIAPAFGMATTYWYTTGGNLTAEPGSYFDGTVFQVGASSSFLWNSPNPTGSEVPNSDGIIFGYGQVINNTNEFYGAYSLKTRFYLPDGWSNQVTNFRGFGTTAWGQHLTKLATAFAKTPVTLTMNLACPCLCNGNDGSNPPDDFAAGVAIQNIDREEPLNWRTTLQDFAQEFANNCTISLSRESRDQDFRIYTGHINPSTVFSMDRIQRRLRDSLSWIGYNSAAGILRDGNETSASAIVWNDEERYFDCVENKCINGPCNHFVTSSSANLENVGCAQAICPATSSPFRQIAPTSQWVLYVCFYNQLPGDSYTRVFPLSDCSE